MFKIIKNFKKNLVESKKENGNIYKRKVKYALSLFVFFVAAIISVINLFIDATILFFVSSVLLLIASTVMMEELKGVLKIPYMLIIGIVIINMAFTTLVNYIW